MVGVLFSHENEPVLNGEGRGVRGESGGNCLDIEMLIFGGHCDACAGKIRHRCLRDCGASLCIHYHANLFENSH